MKMIVAIVRPEMSRTVKDALKDAGINGMTMFPVHGRGAQSGINFTTRTGKFCIDEIEKVMMEIVVEDSQKELAVDVIMKSARTGRHGDGRIFILPVEESYKVFGE